MLPVTSEEIGNAVLAAIVTTIPIVYFTLQYYLFKLNQLKKQDQFEK